MKTKRLASIAIIVMALATASASGQFYYSWAADLLRLSHKLVMRMSIVRSIDP